MGHQFCQNALDDLSQTCFGWRQGCMCVIGRFGGGNAPSQRGNGVCVVMAGLLDLRAG